jgi:hypothetical protein
VSNRRKLWTPGGRNQPSEQEVDIRPIQGSGKLIRLWVCRDCKSIEELPPYDGPIDKDVLLEDTASRHMTEWRTHECSLVKVPESYWNSPKIKEALTKQLSQGGSKGLEEFEGGEDYYGTRDTYREDALKCFSRHQRPKEGCIDWHNPDKRIGNPTSEGWKTGPRVYACDFCPVASWVAKKQQEQSA